MGERENKFILNHFNMPIGLISQVLEHFFPKIKYVGDGRLVAFFFTKT